jgi:hypothetical protein
MACYCGACETGLNYIVDCCSSEEDILAVQCMLPLLWSWHPESIQIALHALLLLQHAAPGTVAQLCV